MNLKRFALWLPLVAAFVCFLNYIGFDRDNMLLLTVSFTGWIMEMIVDIHNVHVFWIYSSTIAFWFVLGYFLDKAIAKRKRKTAENQN